LLIFVLKHRLVRKDANCVPRFYIRALIVPAGQRFPDVCRKERLKRRVRPLRFSSVFMSVNPVTITHEQTNPLMVVLVWGDRITYKRFERFYYVIIIQCNFLLVHNIFVNTLRVITPKIRLERGSHSLSGLISGASDPFRTATFAANDPFRNAGSAKKSVSRIRVGPKKMVQVQFNGSIVETLVTLIKFVSHEQIRLNQLNQISWTSELNFGAPKFNSFGSIGSNSINHLHVASSDTSSRSTFIRGRTSQHPTIIPPLLKQLL
jgi:hypothetical protein